MEFSLFSISGLLFALRWMHIFFGVVWIGHLYYFNFVQGAFFAETDAATKTNAIQKLVPRALWWFRWGAMFTLITGLVLIMGYAHSIPQYFQYTRGFLILIGALLGILMWFNVWFIIWPNQKIVIQNAVDTATGKPALANAAAAAAKAGLASRTNVLFSIPMLFFMASANHLPLVINPGTSLMPLVVAVLAIVGALEWNAFKGKMGPMTTVKGVIHCGVGLTAVLYFLVEFLTK